LRIDTDMDLIGIQTRRDQIIKLANEMVALVEGASPVTPPEPSPGEGDTRRYLYTGMVMIGDNMYVRNATGSHINCQWTREGFLNAIYDSAKEIGRRISIINGTPLDGDCPTSPEGSHREGNAVDYSYFLGVADQFDDAANLAFVLAFNRKLPSYRFRMDEELKTVLKAKASALYDRPTVLLVSDIIWGDTPPGAYNHDTHCHLEKR
jgi:hypothetical protein